MSSCVKTMPLPISSSVGCTLLRSMPLPTKAGGVPYPNFEYARHLLVTYYSYHGVCRKAKNEAMLCYVSEPRLTTGRSTSE